MFQWTASRRVHSLRYVEFDSAQSLLYDLLRGFLCYPRLVDSSFFFNCMHEITEKWKTKKINTTKWRLRGYIDCCGGGLTYLVLFCRVCRTVSCFTIRQKRRNITNSCHGDTTSRKGEEIKYVLILHTPPRFIKIWLQTQGGLPYKKDRGPLYLSGVEKTVLVRLRVFSLKSFTAGVFAVPSGILSRK